MKTAEEILAECAGFTVDQINDSEPVIIVQHDHQKENHFMDWTWFHEHFTKV